MLFRCEGEPPAKKPRGPRGGKHKAYWTMRRTWDLQGRPLAVGALSEFHRSGDAWTVLVTAKFATCRLLGHHTM